eukprot:4543647-Amphidinium_carterae.1
MPSADIESTEQHDTVISMPLQVMPESRLLTQARSVPHTGVLLARPESFPGCGAQAKGSLSQVPAKGSQLNKTLPFVAPPGGFPATARTPMDHALSLPRASMA